jgi:hypothetical protein
VKGRRAHRYTMGAGQCSLGAGSVRLADHPEALYILPGGGDLMRPASISPWQFAHTSTHFFASSRKAASDLPTPMCMLNAFVAGSTWWKWRFSLHRE